MPNRLANETSPYLLQHKDNPVDWYPWGDEALSKAQKEDRPILLSIGYSACHWCHVMERESFENDDIAALMNQHFVNIKVDREERPDLDGIYMQAVQAMTGRGGWPMTVFLMPDGTPFYGGTYFPPEDRHGLPGFPKLLTAVAEAYRDDRESLVRQGQNLIDRIGAADGVTGDPTQILGDDILHTAVAQLRTRFDYQHGGFGSAPKFPNPMDLELLLRYHHRFADKGALDMALTTLRAMANGGIYDQVGGGFHRYSTDAVWLVPHFEKMLYDNAQLAAVYLDAYLVTKDPFYERICRETLDYVLREMTHESGAFFSTQDADSEGEEGKFFVWTPAELDAVLGGDSEAVKRYYGISEAGNFEGKNILHVADEAEPPAALQTAPHKLYEAREQRVHPGRDEKVLTSWNGMMLRAFALAGRSLDDDRYLAAATANADFMLGAMRPEGRLLRTWKAGTARLLGYLEDYACLVDGLIATYEATFEPRYLSRARDLASQMIELFWDADRAIFYDTGKDHEVLVTRPRDVFDNATPAGNSVAIDALLRLSALTGDEAFERVATAALRGMQPFLRQMPSGFGRALSALDFYLATRRELVIVWDDGRAEADALLRTAFDEFRPNVVVAGGKAGPELESLSPLLEARATLDGRPTAYVCQNYACQQPVTDAKALAAQLA